MTLVTHVLPLVLGYFVVAALAVTRGTHLLRIVSWPVVMSLAWRAAATVDTSSSEPNRKLYNAQLMYWVVFVAFRTFEWSLTEVPLVRHLRPATGSQSTIMDALDLASNLRGYGWDWSHGAYIPRETRPTSRGGFTFHLFLSVVTHVLLYDLLHRVILSFSPGLGTISGGSIFDETLPSYLRYFRSTVISVIAAFWIYAIVQAYYNTSTIIGVLVFGQDPAQWPPPFDAPWRATSLSDFWGRRWHQFPRRTLLVFGGYPLSFFLGRPGLVIGTFLASAVMHHMMLILLNKESEPWRMLVGFGTMGPVVLAEWAFKRLTGRKVEGWVGWVWAMSWLFLLGNVIVDGLARGGVFARGIVPRYAVIDRQVANFDCWLHVM